MHLSASALVNGQIKQKPNHGPGTFTSLLWAHRIIFCLHLESPAPLGSFLSLLHAAPFLLRCSWGVHYLGHTGRAPYPELQGHQDEAHRLQHKLPPEQNDENLNSDGEQCAKSPFWYIFIAAFSAGWHRHAVPSLYYVDRFIPHLPSSHWPFHITVGFCHTLTYFSPHPHVFSLKTLITGSGGAEA